jgi:hypothetical protein
MVAAIGAKTAVVSTSVGLAHEDLAAGVRGPRGQVRFAA